MTGTSSFVGYSTLKEKILEMWLPAVGVENEVAFVRNNWRKMFSCASNIQVIPSIVEDMIEDAMERFFENYFFQRNIDSYFDMQLPFRLGKAILTGSFNEGLFLYSAGPPDIDYMCVLDNITFSNVDQENGSLLLDENTPFVSAFLTKPEKQDLWIEFLHDNCEEMRKHRLSSRKLKKKMFENYQKTGGIFRSFCNEEVEEIAEGAALTIRKPEPFISVFENVLEMIEKALRQPVWEPLVVGEFLNKYTTDALLYKLVPSTDIVLCISCEGWPSCAREWITRDRLWPNTHLVNEIAQNGFHIVPKTSSHGDFRLSFSFAESTLIKSLTTLQHRVIRAYKAVVKYQQMTWSHNLKEILTSYHLKTIAFWHLEKSSRQSWTEETIVHHLLTMLEELAEGLRTRDIPMYFMPKVNLLQDIAPSALVDMVEKIASISFDLRGICEALDDGITLKEIYITDGQCDRVVDLFNTIRNEKQENSGKEEECTWYDVVATISGPKLCRENVIQSITATVALWWKYQTTPKPSTPMSFLNSVWLLGENNMDKVL